MTDTRSFPDEIRGKSVKKYSEFNVLVEKISVDPKLWVTTYRCKTSGELWLEIYENTGHGEIPIIKRKVI